MIKFDMNILHINLFITSLRCSHFIFGNLQSHFNSIVHTYFWLYTLSQNKKNKKVDVFGTQCRLKTSHTAAITRSYTEMKTSRLAHELQQVPSPFFHCKLIFLLGSFIWRPLTCTLCFRLLYALSCDAKKRDFDCMCVSFEIINELR